MKNLFDEKLLKWQWKKNVISSVFGSFFSNEVTRNHKNIKIKFKNMIKLVRLHYLSKTLRVFFNQKSWRNFIVSARALILSKNLRNIISISRLFVLDACRNAIRIKFMHHKAFLSVNFNNFVINFSMSTETFSCIFKLAHVELYKLYWH